ncbi:MAG: GNAT family N-acetyltransferase, partial [Clostridia bacterium]|nr:GNAT family N-acetyltransferase [Clostridia bacterium]
TFSSVFGNALCELAETNPKLCAITAAMQSGVGLNEFARKFPHRCFDVGIAEEHAVTMAAGMAAEGLRPVVAIYSTFLQRAYDEILHDVGIMRLPVVFCIDRAGLVGEDGETHQGIYDLAMLKSIPGMEILMPASAAELRSMLQYALRRTDGPTAIRYPRGRTAEFDSDTASRPFVRLTDGFDCTIAAAGRLVDTACTAAEQLSAQGISARVLKLNKIHPLPTDAIAAEVNGALLILEEAASQGSVASELAAKTNLRVHALNCGTRYLPQASVAEQMTMCGLDAASVVAYAKALVDKPTCEIRPATEQDLETLWAQNIAENPDDPRWITWRDEYIRGNQDGSMRTFAILIDGHPVGEGTLLFAPTCSAIRGRTQLADGKQTVNVNALRIQSAYEGNGYVSAMVREMERFAAEKGYRAITIGVEANEARNLGIYLHWGYTALVHTEAEDGALVLYYQKTLA